MNTTKIVDAQKIHIESITTLKGNIDAIENANADAIAGHKFKFELKTGLNAEQHIIGLVLLVDIVATDANQNDLGISGSYTHEIVFRVENLNDFLTPNESEESDYLIDGVLGSTLCGIAYSTVRGIIFTRTQGTSLGTVTLPIIDPRKLIGIE